MSLDKTKIPAWVSAVLGDLIDVAERQFSGRSGASKKAWVKKAAKDLIDLKGVPDVVEDAVIDALVEVIWAAGHGRRKVGA